VLQSEYNLLNRNVEREVLPYCRAHRVGFVPYYPLAGGFLTGKYEKGKAPPAGSRGERDRYVQRWMTERNYVVIKNLVTWAESRGRKINDLAQAWLLAQSQVCSVITGATKVEHILSNVGGANWDLTAEESEEVNAILKEGNPDSP
jgi:aryl-alcohol dehydrogenase-like predicted oxidoreductase